MSTRDCIVTESLQEPDCSESAPLNDDVAPVSNVARRRNRRWSLVLSTLALAALALASLALHRGAAGTGAVAGAPGGRRGPPEMWEELPGMDELVSLAASLPLMPGEKQMPLRELQGPGEPDLYIDDPDKGLFAQIRTQCVIDVVDAANYLGNAVAFMYYAANPTGCPADKGAGCASNIIYFVDALAWVASYISLAASSCADSVNPKAACAADWTAVVGDMGLLAASSTAAANDCNFDGGGTSGVAGAKADLNCNRTSLSKAERLGCQLKSVQAQIAKLKNEQEQKQNAHPFQRFANVASTFQDMSQKQTSRNFDIAQCSFDISWVVTYTIRVVLQLRTSALHCEDPHECAINVMNVISSFAWIGEYIGAAVSDCGEGSNLRALCADHILDLFAATANLGASAAAVPLDCQTPPPSEAEEVEHDTGVRRLATPNHSPREDSSSREERGVRR